MVILHDCSIAYAVATLAKAVKKLASGASALLPAPFSAVANVVEKSIKGLQDADKKIKSIKKSADDYSQSDKNAKLQIIYKNARSEYKKAIKYKSRGDKKNAYLSYQKALYLKKQGDNLK